MISVLPLEADMSSVGWPVDVVNIVGQEILGEVGSWVKLGVGLPRDCSGIGERGLLSSSMDDVGVLSWVGADS